MIRFRLERARETLDEAELLEQAGHWNGCVNRLYYACFYAVSALLLSQGLTSAKHSGVLSLFSLHFVNTGIVPRDLGNLYNRLFQRRLRGDYADLVRFDESDVNSWMSGARRLVSEIAGLLSEPPI